MSIVELTQHGSSFHMGSHSGLQVAWQVAWEAHGLQGLSQPHVLISHLSSDAKN